MFRFARAAGYAVAALVVAVTPSFADPSQAWEAEAVKTALYIDHADANLIAPAAVNEVASAPAFDPNLSAPIAEHAVAAVADSKPIRSDEDRPLHALVEDYASAETDSSELECLAGAIYFESKGEPLDGQLAVAEVIINRSASGRYPGTICGVVKQKGQFSFVRGGRIPAAPRDSAHWRKAVAIAHIAAQDLADSPASKALSFHATHVSPRWKMKRLAKVGNHIFYH